MNDNTDFYRYAVKAVITPGHYPGQCGVCEVIPVDTEYETGFDFLEEDEPDAVYATQDEAIAFAKRVAEYVGVQRTFVLGISSEDDAVTVYQSQGGLE